MLSLRAVFRYMLPHIVGQVRWSRYSVAALPPCSTLSCKVAVLGGPKTLALIADDG